MKNKILITIIILILSSSITYYSYKLYKKTKFQEKIKKLLLIHTDITTDMITTGKNNTASDGQNNPLNIKVGDSNWIGKITPIDGQIFERFYFMWQGFRAGMKNTINVADGKSFNDTIIILSPPSENNVTNYKSFVGQHSGVNLDTPINQLNGDDFKALIKAMAMFEQGNSLEINEYDVNMAYASLQPDT